MQCCNKIAYYRCCKTAKRSESRRMDGRDRSHLTARFKSAATTTRSRKISKPTKNCTRHTYHQAGGGVIHQEVKTMKPANKRDQQATTCAAAATAFSSHQDRWFDDDRRRRHVIYSIIFGEQEKCVLTIHVPRWFWLRWCGWLVDGCGAGWSDRRREKCDRAKNTTMFTYYRLPILQ